MDQFLLMENIRTVRLFCLALPFFPILIQVLTKFCSVFFDKLSNLEFTKQYKYFYRTALSDHTLYRRVRQDP
jgi:hypothetical protein